MSAHCKLLLPQVAALLSVLLFSGHLYSTEPETDHKYPNILVFLVDDMGFSDIGAYGGEIHTPNIDGLAEHGLRFTQFYNTGRCWPSRASLLTGYYPQSIRRDVTKGKLPGSEPANGVGDRPAWAPLLPLHLKPFGYRSFHVGKWHLDGTPLQGGFDRSYLNMNELGYFRAVNQQLDEVDLPDIKADGEFYSTVTTVSYAVKFLREHQQSHASRPFFGFVAFNSPHFPVQALPEDIAIYRDRYNSGWDILRERRLDRLKKLHIVSTSLSALDPDIVPRRNLGQDALQQQVDAREVAHAVPWNTLTKAQQTFQARKMEVHAAMVHRIDLEVGRVIEQLRAMGALDNTLILFLSDNGASAEQMVRRNLHQSGAEVGGPDSYLCMGPGWSSASNTPFRLHKSWVHEGGIATPLIVHWPAGLDSQGELRSSPAHLIDLLPTVLDIVRGNDAVALNGAPSFPGLSLVPAFQNDSGLDRDFLWWSHDGNRAIRVGDWKLVALRSSPWELYNLAEDRSEKRNLASRYPARVTELEALWTAQAKAHRKLAQGGL